MAELFPCPSCGGQLVYDPTRGQMKCRSCGSFFDVEGYKPKSFDYTRQILTCPSCGGEVAAPSLEGMEFCPYCGTEIANAQAFSEKGYPELIIPFSLSKEDCIDRYRRMVKGVPFLPDELSGTDGLSSFVGLYTPYWIYHYKASGTVVAPVEKYTSDAVYDYHYLADMKTDLDCSISMGVDASATLDDTVSEKLDPFFIDKLEEFNPDYMAGFYAENSTVDPSVYVDSARAKCSEIIVKKMDQMAEENNDYSIGDFKGTCQRVADHLTVEKECTGAYLPLWFLTTRKNNRVAYTVVNGQTGVTYADLPVDIGKYVRASLITSFVCAILLLLLFAVFGTIDMRIVPYVTLIFSSVLMIISAIQSERIYRKENHTDDAGYTGVKKRAEYNAGSFKVFSGKDAAGLVVGGLCLIGFFGNLFSGNFFKLIGIASIVVALVVIATRTSGSFSKTTLFAGAGAAISLADIFLAPHQDIFLYGLIIANLLVLIIVAYRLTADYNRLATSPLPQFQKTGGGLNERY